MRGLKTGRSLRAGPIPWPISPFTPTHMQRPMAAFELDAYPAVVAWLERVQNDTLHVEMEWKP